MIPYFVQIVGNGGGVLNGTVFAPCCKAALIKFVKALPEEHKCWNWPGWQVNVHPQRYAFIVAERGLLPNE